MQGFDQYGFFMADYQKIKQTDNQNLLFRATSDEINLRTTYSSFVLQYYSWGTKLFTQIWLFSNIYIFVTSYCADSYYFIVYRRLIETCYQSVQIWAGIGSDAWNSNQYTMLPFSGTLLPL